MFASAGGCVLLCCSLVALALATYTALGIGIVAGSLNLTCTITAKQNAHSLRGSTWIAGLVAAATMLFFAGVFFVATLVTGWLAACTLAGESQQVSAWISNPGLPTIFPFTDTLACRVRLAQARCGHQQVCIQQPEAICPRPRYATAQACRPMLHAAMPWLTCSHLCFQGHIQRRTSLVRPCKPQALHQTLGQQLRQPHSSRRHRLRHPQQLLPPPSPGFCRLTQAPQHQTSAATLMLPCQKARPRNRGLHLEEVSIALAR